MHYIKCLTGVLATIPPAHQSTEVLKFMLNACQHILRRLFWFPPNRSAAISSTAGVRSQARAVGKVFVELLISEWSGSRILSLPELNHGMPDSFTDRPECVLSVLTKVKSRGAMFELWVRRAWAISILCNDIIDDEDIQVGD